MQNVEKIFRDSIEIKYVFNFEENNSLMLMKLPTIDCLCFMLIICYVKIDKSVHFEL